MDIGSQIDRLHHARAQAIGQERIIRDAAFLHSPGFPLLETIGEYSAMPLTMFHCNLLRMMNSPFLPPFETPAPQELAAFLWVINPKFTREESQAKRSFFKSINFVPPAKPLLVTHGRITKWEKKSADTFAQFTEVTRAAREFVTEALQDKPPAGNSSSGPDYYSDFCWISAQLMRNYHGLDFETIQHLPLKIVYQFLKEIREHHAAKNGKPALLWNGSDRFTDQVLELLNKN